MKKMLVALGLLAAVAVAAWAQTSGTNTVSQGGYYFNAKTGNRTTADGDVRVYQSNAPSLVNLAPTQVFSGTIADGAADTTSVVDLSGYNRVGLLFQVSKNGPNDWLRFAVNARYNLAGLSDSLSMFTIPVSATDDSTVVLAPLSRVALPAVGACGAGEFPVTVLLTGASTAATTHSLPQGKIVWLTVPAGFVWPSNCSFRIRNIGREAAAVTPTVRVWVFGTAL